MMTVKQRALVQEILTQVKDSEVKAHLESELRVGMGALAHQYISTYFEGGAALVERQIKSAMQLVKSRHKIL